MGGAHIGKPLAPQRAIKKLIRRLEIRTADTRKKLTLRRGDASA
jgi:hypothetical protein